MTDAAATTSSTFRGSLRGFGPLGVIAILVIVAGVMVGPVVSAVLILGWTWLSKTPWAEIGYGRPRSWIGGAVIGIVLGIAFKVAMKALVMPLLGGPSVNPAFHYMAGNPTATLEFAATVILAVGWAEETVFRGYLFERFGKLLGKSAGATVFIVLLTAVIFGAAHYTGQGVAGVEQATIVGLVLGTIYALSRKIWMLAWLHTAFDLTAAAMIYFDAEDPISHLVFK